MGISGIGIGPLLLIALIVVLLFGTRKLRNAGGDIGGAIKNFKKAVKDEDAALEDQSVVAEKVDQKEADKVE